MAVIQHIASSKRFALAARTVVGRGAECSIRIPGQHTSGEHASVAWTPAGWHVRDLASTNGTWLDGARLVAGKRSALMVGSAICFGDPKDPWQLIDEGPPGPSAWNHISGELRAGAEGTLVIGGLRNNGARTVEHGPNGWQLLGRGHARAVADGDSVHVGSTLWTLLLPPMGKGTRSTRRREDQLAPLALSSLELLVSSDEEHVDVTIRGPDGRVTQLPSSRSCHYVLATLARLQVAGGRTKGQWVSVHELASSLRYTVERLNVEIHRARRLFAQAGAPDAYAIVERSGDGRLRIGTANVSVKRAVG